MLAVAVKKRLMLFHYDGTDLVELRDVALVEAPVAAAWAGNYICLACKSMCGRGPYALNPLAPGSFSLGSKARRSACIAKLNIRFLQFIDKEVPGSRQQPGPAATSASPARAREAAAPRHLFLGAGDIV